jgi:ArsR family transcriptional regulator, arsenate/arsenite/antimonite-responsive transcriptional repressor
MDDVALAKIFKALSNEQRLRILRMLYEWHETGASGEITEGCCGVKMGFTRACCSVPIARSTVSHHFKELQNAGLISTRRNGQAIVCTINMEAVDAVRKFLPAKSAKTGKSIG